MSEAQLKRLESEKKRLEDEVAFTADIMKVSEACASLITSIKDTPDPFVDPNLANPYTKKTGGGGCSVL